MRTAEASAAGHDASEDVGTMSRRVHPPETSRAEWNGLAARNGSVFLTYEWLTSWCDAFGDETLWLELRGPDGTLRAGACCRRRRFSTLTAATDPRFSEDWDVLAADDRARRDAWAAVAAVGMRHMRLGPMLADSAVEARDVLTSGRYRVLLGETRWRPYVPLPGTWDELLDSVSRNLRKELRRKRRALEHAGEIRVRTNCGQDGFDDDFETFLALEASGWKGRNGTAIRSQPEAARLYRSFALEAARRGWLRLSILECGRTPVAASLGCAFAGKAYRLKSGFDERYRDDSPGLVLLAEDLRRSIDEGLREYDLLGMPQGHKTRWGTQTRPVVTLRAYRGPVSIPSYLFRGEVRPVLGSMRRVARTVASRRRATPA